MRRMITNKQVVDVVNKAIDDGEIEVGGLPEIEEGDAGKVLKVNEQEDGVEWGEAGGADNALVLPEEAPASQQLVGINISNEQNSLGLGDGLEIANGELNSKLKILYVNFNNSTTLTVSSDVSTKVGNAYYDFIIAQYKAATAVLSYAVNAYFGSLLQTGTQGSETRMGISGKVPVSQLKIVSSNATTLTLTSTNKDIYGEASMVIGITDGKVLTTSVYNVLNTQNPLSNAYLLKYDDGLGNTVKFFITSYNDTYIYAKNIPDGLVSTQYQAVITKATRTVAITTI